MLPKDPVRISYVQNAIMHGNNVFLGTRQGRDFALTKNDYAFFAVVIIVVVSWLYFDVL